MYLILCVFYGFTQDFGCLRLSCLITVEGRQHHFLNSHYAQYEQVNDEACMEMPPLAGSVFCVSPTIEVDLMATL
jgi:hypothetical protein